MGKTQHTAAPWRLDGYSVMGDAHGTVAVLAQAVAGKPHAGAPPEVQWQRDATAAANARLIAAAPDLLAALLGMLSLHIAHHNNPEHAAARAAIAKATEPA